MRPTFQYKGRPVRAAGILFVCTLNGKRLRLMRRYKGKWQDIGGKTEQVDANYIETAIRETCEETNGQLFGGADCRERLTELLKSPVQLQYNQKCKYVMITCELDVKILKESMERFGLSEGAVKHSFKWFEQPPYNLHFRLNSFKI